MVRGLWTGLAPARYSGPSNDFSRSVAECNRFCKEPRQTGVLIGIGGSLAAPPAARTVGVDCTSRSLETTRCACHHAAWEPWSVAMRARAPCSVYATMSITTSGAKRWKSPAKSERFFRSPRIGTTDGGRSTCVYVKSGILLQSAVERSKLSTTYIPSLDAKTSFDLRA